MTRLDIGGDVMAPQQLGFEDLAALPEQVGDVGTLVAGRSGGAVRLRAVLAAAGLASGATELTLSSTDGAFSATVPASSVGDALVLYRLGDEPLPEKLGGPVRFLIPDAAKCGEAAVDTCANVKFLGTIEAHAPRD